MITLFAAAAIAIAPPPGALNPAVTQETIGTTICVRGWTATIRPPRAYTGALKRKQIRQRHLPGSLSNYEEDHFIPLELGGAPRDVDNLWPEPRRGIGGALAKDRLENSLHRQVCSHKITLDAARQRINVEWRANTIAHRKTL